jgi:integrase
MFRERRRTLVIEPWLEDLMLEKSSAKLRAVITIMLDSGMRPFEVAAMRWEDVQWNKNRIFIPVSKSEAGIRHVGMSKRMAFELRLLSPPSESSEPWVFPSDGGRSGRKALSGHISARSVGKMWARMKAQVVAAIAQRYPAEQWPRIWCSTRAGIRAQHATAMLSATNSRSPRCSGILIRGLLAVMCIMT